MCKYFDRTQVSLLIAESRCGKVTFESKGHSKVFNNYVAMHVHGDKVSNAMQLFTSTQMVTESVH